MLLMCGRHCWVDSAAIEQGWGPKAFCPPDEHYIPTLLASLGKENETDCRVGLPVPRTRLLLVCAAGMLLLG